MRRRVARDLTSWENPLSEELGGNVRIFAGADVQSQRVTLGRLGKAGEKRKPFRQRERLRRAGSRVNGQLGRVSVTCQHPFKTLVPVLRQSRVLKVPPQGACKAGPKEQNTGGEVLGTGLNGTGAKGFEILRRIGELG